VGQEVDPADAGPVAEIAQKEPARLLVPREAPPELVGEIMYRYLAESGYLVAAASVSSEPAAAPGPVCPGSSTRQPGRVFAAEVTGVAPVVRDG
jgi:hypothetical protein